MLSSGKTDGDEAQGRAARVSGGDRCAPHLHGHWRSPQNIFVSPNGVAPNGATRQLAVVVRQGGHEFTVTVGPVGMSDQKFFHSWPRAIRVVHALSDDEAKALLESSKIRDVATLLLAEFSLKRAP